MAELNLIVFQSFSPDHSTNKDSPIPVKQDAQQIKLNKNKTTMQPFLSLSLSLFWDKKQISLMDKKQISTLPFSLEGRFKRTSPNVEQGTNEMTMPTLNFRNPMVS